MQVHHCCCYDSIGVDTSNPSLQVFKMYEVTRHDMAWLLLGSRKANHFFHGLLVEPVRAPGCRMKVGWGVKYVKSTNEFIAISPKHIDKTCISVVGIHQIWRDFQHKLVIGLSHMLHIYHDLIKRLILFFIIKLISLDTEKTKKVPVTFYYLDLAKNNLRRKLNTGIPTQYLQEEFLSINDST